MNEKKQSVHASQNMVYAKQAVAYVKKHVHLGAGNKSEDILSSSGLSFLCNIGLRLKGELSRFPDTRLFNRAREQYVPDEMLSDAAKSMSFGCGNCREQSALAFVYLSDLIKPIDYMIRTSADHAFVVVGRARGNASDVSSWGKNAVICDPWHGKAYPAKDFEYEMPGGNLNAFNPEIVLSSF